MTVNYTTLLALGQPVTGTESGTWGDDVNNAVTSYLDIAIAGTLSLTSANFTAGALTLANTQGTSSATNIASTTAQYAVLKVSSLATNSTITAPSASKIYLVINADSTYTVTIKASGQTGYTVGVGTRAFVVFNGTDYVLASTNDITKFSGILGTANGGTGLGGGTPFTANGVVYASSSSALTTGSALTFNGAQLGVTNGAGAAILALNGTSPPEIDFYSSGAIKSYIYAPSTSLQLNTVGTNPIIFLPNEVEQMRLTSTGLGIGTSSPGVKLDVSTSTTDVVKFTTSSGADSTLLTMQGGSGVRMRILPSSGTGKYNWQLAAQTNINDGFEITPSTASGGTTFSTPALSILASSGNVGIGTSSPADILTLAGGASGSYGLTINNAKVGGGTKAIFQYDATNQIALVGGNTTNGLAFQTLTSGSLTTKATLDSSGNLGLGVTPSASTIAQFEGGSNLLLVGRGNAYLSNNATFNSGFKYINSAAAGQYNISGGTHSWYTAPSGTAGNAISFTQAMTLNASGGLSVGTTADPGANNIGIAAGGKLYYSTNAWITPEDNVIGARISGTTVVGFWTGGSERARITSGGQLLINTTDSGIGGTTQLVVKGPATNTQQVAAFWNPSATNTQYFLSFGTDTTYTERGYITWNGTTTAIANASDQRLKTNIVDAPSALAKVDAIKIRSFDFIADNRHIDYGVIAQELETVIPAAVFKGSDNEDGTINKPWAVGLEPLIPVLVKAIQEQQAIITDLRARVAQLEAK